jgi:NAD(P)-dependent dehydrogenase (short-subunit alcohol dehydrogenase family)
VNVICPGVITDYAVEFFKTHPQEYDKYASKLALGRFVEPQDIGRLCVYLASPDCFLTGQTFYCDGGQGMFP